MKRILIGTAIGTVLTVVFFTLAGFFGGACHCVTPTTAFFPYAAIVWGATTWDSMGTVLIALQFPFYAIVLIPVRGIPRRILSFVLLLLVHSAAIVAGLRVYHH